MQSEFDALIIGAGPAGSTAAILLAQAGWNVALLEKQNFPRRKVCGECIAASNLPLLDALGIGRQFDALAGAPLRRLALMHAEQTIFAELPPLANVRHQWGRALGRELLDNMLLLRAREVGANVFQPWAVKQVEGRPGAYTCHASDLQSGMETVLSAPVVIAAHGSWGISPMALGKQSRPKQPQDLFAFKANFEHAALGEGVLPVLAFPGGYGGMVVGEQGIATLACCIRRERLHAWRKTMPGQDAGSVVEASLKAECRGVRDALAGARRKGKWLSTGPIMPGIRMPRDGGDIFLVGNAAGEAHPIIGEGISMAMQSAWLLCEHLLEHRNGIPNIAAQVSVQRDYAKTWHANFAQRIRLAAAFAHLAMRPSVSTGLLPVLKTWPSLLTRAARWSGKVRLSVDPQVLPVGYAQNAERQIAEQHHPQAYTGGKT